MRYVAPISMLIVVCFISAFVFGLLSSPPDGVIEETETVNNTLIYNVVLAVIDFIMNSMVIRNLTIYIPALLAIPIVYGAVGARKYNVAEYFAAMIYMTSSMLLFGILISPLSLISDTWYSGVEMTYAILICSLSMYKAFPINSLKRRIGYFILYLAVSILIYLLIIGGIAALVVLEKR